MKRFVLNPSLGMAFIPGLGKVMKGRVVMGDEYAKYSPRLLTEVPEVPVSAAPLLVEPAPSVVPIAAPVAVPVVPVNEETGARMLNEVVGDAQGDESGLVEGKRKPGRPKGSTKTGG